MKRIMCIAAAALLLVSCADSDSIKAATADLLLNVGGKRKFACKLGRYKDRRAVKVLRRARPGERF